MQRHLQCGLLLTLALSGGLLAAEPRQPHSRELIPGYVDAQGQVHPEKLLSYIDALHRAADADRADARIVQLESHLSEVVAQLAQTRAIAARQQARARKAETDAAQQRQLVIDTQQELTAQEARGDKLTRSLKRTQTRLRRTRRSLVGQQAQVILLRKDHHRLQTQVSGLILSLQHSQSRATHFSANLARAAHERDFLHASARDASAVIQTLTTQLKQSRDDHQKTTASLQATKARLSKTERSLKQKRSTPPDSKSTPKETAEKTRSPKVESTAPKADTLDNSAAPAPDNSDE